MLAVETLSAGWTAFFTGAGVVLFAVAALLAASTRAITHAAIAGGLAFVTFVSFWNALAAA